jgi:hypothetical protein
VPDTITALPDPLAVLPTPTQVGVAALVHATAVILVAPLTVPLVQVEEVPAVATADVPDPVPVVTHARALVPGHSTPSCIGVDEA